MNGMTRRDRQVTDINEIIKILNKSKVVHLGMADGDEPYVVPMNYGYTLKDGALTLYLHCAKQGRKLDIIRKNPNVFFEMDCDIQPIEGDTACEYSTAYASVMGRGTAEIVENTEEKKYALSVLMKTQTGKDFTFDDKMINAVTVIKITALEYTAKQKLLP